MILPRCERPNIARASYFLGSSLVDEDESVQDLSELQKEIKRTVADLEIEWSSRNG